MNRRCALLLTFALALLPAAAATRPEFRYQAGMVYFAARGIQRDVMAYSSELRADGANYSGTLGFQAYSDVVDVAAMGTFFPGFSAWDFPKMRMRLGFGAIYHFQNQVGTAHENDVIVNTTFSLSTVGNLTVEIGVGYGRKATKIKAVADSAGWIYDEIADTTVVIRKLFDCGADVFVSFSSRDLYQYPAFISPIYTVGGAWRFRTNLRPYGEISARMCDMFVTAPYLDRLQFKLGIGYSF